MATDLVGNEKLQRFIALLADLNNQTADMLKTGNVARLKEMNETVREMYSIQHGNTEEAYAAIDGDAEIIYENFNAIVTMIKTADGDPFDPTTSRAVKVFLRNIFDADIRIVSAYGLV